MNVHKVLKSLEKILELKYNTHVKISIIKEAENETISTSNRHSK